MSDRDPLQFLTPAIDRPKDPDPDFAADLLDQLLAELSDDAPSLAVPLSRPSHPDDHLSAETDEESSVQILTPVVDQETQDTHLSWHPRLFTAAAAVIVLLLGSLAVLRLGADEGSLTVSSGERSTAEAEEDVPRPTPPPTPAPITPAPITSAQQTAIDFLTARREHDGPAMRALLADDAEVANEFGVDAPDDYLARVEFDRLTNTEIFDITCEPLPSSERVSCPFEFRNDVGRHLRSEPYRAELVITVRDGLIVDLLAAPDGIYFESDTTTFLDWLGQTHPEDLAAIVDDSWLGLSMTSASGAILAARSPEFAATTEPPILKLLADDPRFTTFVEAIQTTRLGDELSACTITTTLFAPTNAALDDYIVASGLDRATVLDDVALFETFVVADVVRLLDPALGEQSVELVTRSGDQITVITGTEPSVEGIPILADTLDIAACNGAIQGIDEIYALNG